MGISRHNIRLVYVVGLMAGMLVTAGEARGRRLQLESLRAEALAGLVMAHGERTGKASAIESIHDPHVPARPGPWFEGWYFRVSDAGGSRSVAVIVASHLPRGETYVPGMVLPGYINVLICEGDGAPTLSFTAYPQQTQSLVAGRPVSATPRLAPAPDFEWVAEGFGSVTEDSVNLQIPGEVEISIRTENRLPWDAKRPAMGPEGLLMFLPVPLHWYVHSLASDASYSYSLSGAEQQGPVSGTGYAHLEKNWQREFPAGWVWAQGIAENNRAQFVISQADIALKGGAGFRPWILGYRSDDLHWDFRFHIPGATLATDLDPCAGTLRMEARDLFRTLTVEAFAPPGSFGSVSIPTAEGFVAESGGESFSATVVVSAYWHVPLLGKLGLAWLAEQQVFNNAALEFGNAYACQEQ
ncbi:MAG: hypothetical protein JW832_16305 [Deltaproteobacteria bacterium]|nr:hypothetical protein [Deltaproteobacteria bacterium]